MATRTAGVGAVRTVAILLGILLLLPVLHMAVMMPVMGMTGMMDGGHHQMGATGMSPFWGIAMMVLSLLVVVGLVYVGYRLLTQGTGFTEDPAVEELRLAFARGDIPEEEYEERREALKQDR